MNRPPRANRISVGEHLVQTQVFDRADAAHNSFKLSSLQNRWWRSVQPL